MYNLFPFLLLEKMEEETTGIQTRKSVEVVFTILIIMCKCRMQRTDSLVNEESPALFFHLLTVINRTARQKLELSSEKDRPTPP